MDRAYEGDETRQWVFNLPLFRSFLPKVIKLMLGKMIARCTERRNEIERLFRRLKGFRRIFSRFEKLDVMFIAFIHFALIVEAFRSVNTP